MFSTRAVVFAWLTALSLAVKLEFPSSFKFGAATSSYQIEGGWNEGGKTESIWDVHVHRNPSPIIDNTTGDVAADSYHLWERDIEIAEEMNLDFYRFSLSWPRILPNGFSNKVNEEGIRYYNNLIDGLLSKGIEPVVTIYHWDLPKNFQDLGGWLNPLIAEWFSDFARVVYTHFGDRVKIWLTINEPLVVCDATYNTGNFAPPIQDDDILPYICTKNLLLAHAKAYRVYDEEFRHLYHGKVSMANHFIWYEPKDAANEEDVQLAELANELGGGRYFHPVFGKEGGWPPSVEKLVAQNSAAQGYPRSRLPAFTKEEIDLVKGTSDFFGLNHYMARQIRKALPDEEIQYFEMVKLVDLPRAIVEVSPDWPATQADWLFIHRESTRYALSWLKSHYGDIEFFITETGYPSTTGLEDDNRVKYIQEQLTQILLSIYEDGVNVTGYAFWSLIDNFEWSNGYRDRFGLYEINFDDPARTRVPKKSAKYYTTVTTNRALDKLYL